MNGSKRPAASAAARSIRMITAFLLILLMVSVFAVPQSYALDAGNLREDSLTAAAETGAEASEEESDDSGDADVTSIAGDGALVAGEVAGRGTEAAEETAAAMEAGGESSGDPGDDPGVPGDTDDPTEPADPATCVHVWGDWQVTKAATYFKKGRQTRTCELCATTETAVIPKLTGRNIWIKDNGKRYYLGSKGKPVTGWHKLKTYQEGNPEKWCYFTSKSGTLKKKISADTKNKWVTVGNHKYYFSGKSKPLSRGFYTISGKYYYIGKNKALAVKKFTLDGNTYRPRSDGTLSEIDYLRGTVDLFVYVYIPDQWLRVYKNGSKVMSVPVVTGTKGVHDTPAGSFRIMSKSRGVRLVGPDWNVGVKYWMQFRAGGYGLHDASWRSSGQFNKNTYKSNGSHGCINMRSGDAGRLYNTVSVGTRVYVRR